jgi:hypothetical protein
MHQSTMNHLEKDRSHSFPFTPNTNLVQQRKNRVCVQDFDAVVVCNGHFSEANLPDVAGMEVFPGQQLHSHNYRTNEPFRDKVQLPPHQVFGRERGLAARRSNAR